MTHGMNVSSSYKPVQVRIDLKAETLKCYWWLWGNDNDKK